MDTLITLYRQRLNLQNATFSRVVHEDALVAIVYKVTQPDGTQCILKICPRPQHYFREVYFLNHFADIVPVPRIMQVVDPEEGSNGAILMECLDGALLKRVDFTGSLAYEIGEVFARIHLNHEMCYGDLISQGDLQPAPRIYFTREFEEVFAECSNFLPQELMETCRSYFERHSNLLASVDGPCIVHRDFRPGNLIVYDGKLQGVIDWSSGRAGFAEEDFCTLEHSVWQSNPDGKSDFLAGYARIRPIPDYGTIMPLLRLTKALASLGFAFRSGTWESSSARLYQFNRHYLETFF